MAAAAAAAAGGGFSICCNPNHHTPTHHHHHHHHHHHLLLSINSLHPPKPSMFFATFTFSNHNSLKLSSTSLTAAALPPPPPPPPLSSTSPSHLESQSSMTSAVEEQHESLDEAAKIEELWQQLFSDPSQWWDRRFHKRKPEGPDFKHKSTKKALWINDKCNPSWLQERLATLTQQPPQKSEFSFSLSSSSASSSSSSAYSSSSAGRVSSGQASRTKELWEDFFSDPSQWWDHRSDDKNERS